MPGAVATGRSRSERAGAVNVLTYHGAKCLEWPVVVLTDLEKGLNGHLFGLSASTVGEVYWRNPLAGRVLRFCPWPYGAQEKGVHLDDAAEASPEGVVAQEAARREALQLLYVGTIRARIERTSDLESTLPMLERRTSKSLEAPVSNPSTTTLSSKGQVVIPEAIRVRLGLAPGTRFVVVAEGDVVVFNVLEAPEADEFAGLVAQALAIAREEGLRAADVRRAVREARRKG